MSPDSRELARYEAYMRHELPRVVRRNVEDAIRQALGPLQSSLIGDFVGIVRDSQDAVFRSYRQSQGLDDQLSAAHENIPTLEFACAEELPGAAQQNGLITAMFHAPPSQSEESMLESPMMDDVQSGTTASSTNGLRSEHDSGYASEQIMLCGCWNLCKCSDVIDTEIAEQEHENVTSWNDWAAFPDWNLLESVGASFKR